jgi:hypothetical protein
VKTETQTAIKELVDRAKKAQPHEALHLSQAALNLAQAIATLKGAGELPATTGQ